MSGSEYVKFMTEEIISYLQLSSDEKKRRKEKRKDQMDPPASRWFGILPFALQLLLQQKRNSK